MRKLNWLYAGAIALAGCGILSAIVIYGFQRWSGSNAGRDSLLSLMPVQADAVLFADFSQLRASPFAAEFLAWIPQAKTDPEYLKFVRETNFDYERDLDRIAIAVQNAEPATKFLAVADGHFDSAKIKAFASKSGAAQKQNGREVFTALLSDSRNTGAVSGAATPISFAFLSKSRIAITNQAGLLESIGAKKPDSEVAEWLTRFNRLAGSPVFAVIRQDSATSSLMAAQAPGGLQSPQLSALLEQMSWITLAGRPEADRLRLVAEGECTSDQTSRQLSDFLNGILLLAQAGLNGPRTRQQLPSDTREAYIEILKGTDVSRIDRGETKSVRLMFDITPKLLEAAKRNVPNLPVSPTNRDGKSTQPH